MTSQYISYCITIYLGSALVCRFLTKEQDKKYEELTGEKSKMPALSLLPVLNTAMAICLIGTHLVGLFVSIRSPKPVNLKTDQYKPAENAPETDQSISYTTPGHRPHLIPLPPSDCAILDHVGKIDISRWRPADNKSCFTSVVSGLKIRIGLSTHGVAMVEIGDNFYICHEDCNDIWRRVWQHFNNLEMKRQLRNAETHDKVATDILKLFNKQPDGLL